MENKGLHSCPTNSSRFASSPVSALQVGIPDHWDELWTPCSQLSFEGLFTRFLASFSQVALLGCSTAYPWGCLPFLLLCGLFLPLLSGVIDSVNWLLLLSSAPRTNSTHGIRGLTRYPFKRLFAITPVNLRWIQSGGIIPCLYGGHRIRCGTNRKRLFATVSS